MLFGKYIGFLAKGAEDLVREDDDLLRKLFNAFATEVHGRDDWFYDITVDGHEFFFVDNGMDGYTAMLANEY